MKRVLVLFDLAKNISNHILIQNSDKTFEITAKGYIFWTFGNGEP